MRSAKGSVLNCFLSLLMAMTSCSGRKVRKLESETLYGTGMYWWTSKKSLGRAIPMWATMVKPSSWER